MGLGGVEGPPKKKLKQAQLNFCVTTEKTNNKRKLSDSSGGLAKKLFRKDSGTLKVQAFNKENVIAENIDKQKKLEPENDEVIEIDEDSKNNDEPACEVTHTKVSDETAESKVADEKNEVIEIDEDSRDNEKPACEVIQSEAVGGTNECKIANETVEKNIASEVCCKDVVKIENDGTCQALINKDVAPISDVGTTSSLLPTEDKRDDSLSVRGLLTTAESSKPTDSGSDDSKPADAILGIDKSTNEWVSKVEPKDCAKPVEDVGKDKVHADSKNPNDSRLDKSDDADLGDANTSIVVSSEDEHAAISPNQKTTPNRKPLATPKSSTKKAERERQREEKLRLKKEKEEQKRKEKEEKEKKKQEELRMKEEEKKKKEEERKRKEEAKEEERKRKEEDRKRKEEAKEEERRKKEEERKKKEEMKEEERRKKEEARLAEEKKEKEKEERAKAAFTKFFITDKSKPSLLKNDETEAHDEKTEKPKFMPFPVKTDMRLAVQVRHILTEEEKESLTNALTQDQSTENTYLKELKDGRKPRSSPGTWPLSEEQHDVIIVEFVDDDNADTEQEAKSNAKSKGQKAKLLQFHENRRPPYWGTWRKPSKTVGPRRPFGQEKILDYEVDSDSEWEDEEEGEDIDKEDGDSDKEEADDENVGENGYMLDNTFVPHGYLSDEEAAEAEDDDSIEDQKLKLTALKQEFDQELKSKTQRLQPKLLGCVYISNKTLEVSKSLYEPLMKLRCKWNPSEDPIDVLSLPVVECNPSPSVSNAKFPSSMVEQLAKLIHGNRSSLKALITEFLNSCDNDTQLSAISKRAVFLKVKEIATKTYSSTSGRLVWAVNPDLCSELGLAPIAEPPKSVPVVSPVVEPLKLKDSPLASFLKKSTPQGSIKRVSTTLIPRSGPSETPLPRGVAGIHVDTPRPKVTPQGTILTGSHPGKPIRRVATTLLSSVAGAVKNKTFNVDEIDKPGQLVPTAVSAAVDLTDSNDGIIPLPDEADESVTPVLAACHLKTSPKRDASDSPRTNVPTASEPSNRPVPSPSGSTKPPSYVSITGDSAGPQDTDVPNPIRMETDESPVSTSVAVPPADSTGETKVVLPADSTDSSAVLIDNKPSPMETDVPSGMQVISTAQPPAVPSHAAKPLSLPSDAEPPTIRNDAEHKEANPISSTTTPIRKRVPLVTLSKTLSNPKKISKSPGQRVSIADMFCRKPAKKDTPTKPCSLEPSAVVDLCDD